MLTNNFYRMLASLVLNNGNSTVPVKMIGGGIRYWGNTSFTIPYIAADRNSDGIESPYLGRYVKSKPTSTTSFSGSGVCFGTGDAAPSPEDLNISGAAISEYTASVVIKLGQDETGKAYAKATYTINNSADSEVTIKEVALFQKALTMSVPAGESGGTSANIAVLLDRTVLDTPVTIPAGGIGQVVYTITFNLPV